MSLGISCINVTVDRDVAEVFAVFRIQCRLWNQVFAFQNSTNALLVQNKEPHTSGLRAESS